MEGTTPRPRGRLAAYWGCLRMTLMIGLPIGGIIAACIGLITVIGILTEDLWLVPGDASQFDVMGALPKVKDHAGEDVHLQAIIANYVRSDGRLELTADYKPAPYVEYYFYKQVDAPKDAPPPGAGGSGEGIWFRQVRVKISKPWQWSGTQDNNYLNPGMDRDEYAPQSDLSTGGVPDPICDFADLWKIALEKGANPNAVAVIRYDAAGYRFTINDTTINLYFDMECKLTS